MAIVILVMAGLSPATFPGRDGRIAFVHKERGRARAAYTMRRDGTHEHPLVQRALPTDYSPDGKRILFVPYQNPKLRSGLYVVRANGSHVHRIPHTTGALDGAFSPSGKRVALTLFHQKTSHFDIYTVHVDGSHRKRLTHLNGAGEPEYSPNGKWIAFAGPPCDIVLMRANGTHQRHLTQNTTFCDSSPDFSPNGRSIVFRRDLYGQPPKSGIYSIRRDGTHLSSLYQAGTKVLGNTAVFSPSGRHIAFSRRKSLGRPSQIYTMRPDGSHVRQLSHGKDFHDEPSWGVRP